jgi:large subunit ribosomal protein L22
VLRHARLSPYKVREVLDLVRGRPVHEAEDILRYSERDAAFLVGKLLHSAISNAENNDELEPEELYVSACFADEGTTIKRWRPRARGRVTRIRKRTSHITVIVSRMPEEQLRRLQAHRRAEQLAARARRVAGARRSEGDTRSRAERRHGGEFEEVHDHDHDHDEHDEEVVGAAPEAEEAAETDVGASAQGEAGASGGEADVEAGEADDEAAPSEGVDAEADEVDEAEAGPHTEQDMGEEQ